MSGKDRLKPESYPHQWTVEAQILDELVIIHVILKVAVAKLDVAPVESIADGGVQLPGSLRFAGADVGIVRDIPVLIQHEGAFNTDDAVPETG